jgi:TRAP-type C4-dicarboxylate transport system permease small subunit
LPKLESFSRVLSEWFSRAGAVILTAMLIISSADIVGSKFFNLPVLGSVELIGFLMAVMVCLPMALTETLGRHIKVEVFTDRLPKAVNKMIDGIISLVLIFFFAMVVWQLFIYGIYIQAGREYSQDLHLPIHVFLYAMSIGLIPACLVFLIEFLNSLRGAKRS